jgi:transcription initiation factor TFIIF subunit beta
MADTLIKPDPDAKGASPAPFNDEDIYEDAGDLEFNTDPEFQKLYLARVPRYLWEAWSKLDDDAEIQIGTIRQTVENGPNGDKRVCIPYLFGASFPDSIHRRAFACYYLPRWLSTNQSPRNTS